MADRDDESMFNVLRTALERDTQLTRVSTVSDLQDKEAEETEQKIINEGQRRLLNRTEQI